MKFWIDECISPSLARHLGQTGDHDAVHPRDRGRLQEPDHRVFSRAVDKDRIIVTENAEDFRKLAASVSLHSDLVILPSVAKAGAQRLMDRVATFLVAHGGPRPADLLVNAVLTIDVKGVVSISSLP